jgi:hypothetical protein
MRLVVSIILSAILAAASLGAAASPSSATVAMESGMTHAAHGAAAVIEEAPMPACPDAGCPDEHHEAACATQVTHCKITADLGPSARIGLDLIAEALRWRIAHDVGAGEAPELDLPPPRF